MARKKYKTKFPREEKLTLHNNLTVTILSASTMVLLRILSCELTCWPIPHKSVQIIKPLPSTIYELIKNSKRVG